MTGLITMFDSAYDTTFPRGAQAYAAYVDGQVGSQPNYNWIVKEFPNAYHLSITLSAAQDADAIDVEFGAAGVQDVPGWWERQRGRGIARPVVYASASTMQTGIVPLIRSGRIPRGSVRLWSAHYQGEHICSASSCGAVSFEMDGTQWTPTAFGRSLDQSLLVADFFAGAPVNLPTAPTAPPWQEAMLNQLPELAEGAEDRPGTVEFVYRLRAYVAAYGQITGLQPAGSLPSGHVFDAATKAAVQQVQEHMHLDIDGKVQADEWSVLITGAA